MIDTQFSGGVAHGSTARVWRHALCLASLAWGVGLWHVDAPADEPAEATSSPNVVLVITEEGWLDFAGQGSSIVKTPHLDRLYSQSVRLTNFHVDPLSSPTRAAVLTGRYAARAGVWAENTGRSLLRADEKTLADLLSAAGYRTAMLGKWHLGDNCPFRPQDRGFQEALVLGGGGIGQTPDFWGNRGFDDTYFHNGRPEKCTGYSTDVFFSGAIRFIERSPNGPFFCCLAPSAPPMPHRVDERYSRPYRDQGVAEETAERYGLAANFDENMGRLMECLEQRKLADRTILAVMADRGTAAGSGDAKFAGKEPADEAWHHAPCYVRWPGRAAGGRDIDTLSAHVDLLTTLVEACSLEKHVETIALDGASLVPLLSGSQDPSPERVLIVDRQQPEPVKWTGAVVMTDRWRLVGRDKLYDVRTDPAETTGVAKDHRDVMDELLRAYERWWTEIFEPVPDPCPIRIGADQENPARLTAFDWSRTGSRVPWLQEQVKDDQFYANGSWAIDVVREGTYRFALRRFPVEENRAIGADAAWLKVGHVEVTAAIPQGAAEVRQELWLSAGKTRLETKFTDKRTGRFRGAYFVYVERLP